MTNAARHDKQRESLDEDDTRLRVRDAASLRAVAHPARLRAIQHLTVQGPATATELGEVAGLTPSAMSYHLRLLERAGIIETAPGRGDGRERVWQSKYSAWDAELDEDGTSESREASLELLEAVLTLQEVDTRQWMANANVPGWLDDGFFIDTTILATTDELFELGRQISALIKPLSLRERRDSAPEGASPTRTIFRGFQAVGATATDKIEAAGN
ncbi:MAG TPA: metalloregulator ArsR/SmtB family transcription factor [Micromonosporaceae bacterium]|jgi:DNA-binding transcriptional ArsR family regulator